MYPNKKTMLMLLCSLPLAACSSLKDHVEDVDFDDIGDTFNEQFEEIEFQDRMDDFLDDLRD
jgi:hypothetical protein